ncbi:MAG TPA: RNA polymerase sigma-54 factor, partial [Clostridiaceae bacterium]|nr:RNA polymerase sigma-54 factor [Clostridiaceae bacterium]
QEQKLVMTPELQMAVKVLQLTSCELNEFIQNEIEENPLLDYKENCEENSYDTADDNGINDF